MHQQQVRSGLTKRRRRTSSGITTDEAHVVNPLCVLVSWYFFGCSRFLCLLLLSSGILLAVCEDHEGEEGCGGRKGGEREDGCSAVSNRGGQHDRF